jgi:hypothetical protein
LPTYPSRYIDLDFDEIKDVSEALNFPLASPQLKTPNVRKMTQLHPVYLVNGLVCRLLKE